MVGLVIFGALAFQGVLSLFESDLPPREVIVQAPTSQPVIIDDGRRYTTAAIGNGNIYAFVGKTGKESLESAKNGCPGCSYTGPSRGRCVGVWQHLLGWRSDVVVIEDDEATAEIKALAICRARSPAGSSHCWGAKTVCGNVE